MSYSVTAVFEFRTGPPEQQVLYVGPRADCDRLADELERKTTLGLAGLRYDGDRDDLPVQAVVVVHPTEEAANVER